MVRIRLRREGKKGQPSYRIVAAEREAPRDGRFLEILGHYNPRTQPSTISIKEDRVYDWISRGAQPSDSVWQIFRQSGTDERIERFKAGEDVETLLAEAAAAKTKVDPRTTDVGKPAPKAKPAAEAKPVKTEKPVAAPAAEAESAPAPEAEIETESETESETVSETIAEEEESPVAESEPEVEMRESEEFDDAGMAAEAEESEVVDQDDDVDEEDAEDEEDEEDDQAVEEEDEEEDEEEEDEEKEA